MSRYKEFDETALSAIVVASKTIFIEMAWFQGLQQKQFLFMNDSHDLSYILSLSAQLLNKEKKIRIPNYNEMWIFKYEECDFFSHFRMKRKTFHFLVSEIGRINEKLAENIPVHFGGIPPVPLEKAILVLLWHLAKGDTYNSTADRFNIGLSTAYNIILKYLKSLGELRHKFIKWPSQEEAILIAQTFQVQSGYPGIIGAIDGTYFPCVVPSDQHDSYQNRKLQHSVIMQAVADSNTILTDIFVGFPGSCNDGRVLHESPIFRKIEEEGSQSLFYHNFHLVGDKAYVCFEWLMTPYRDTGRLTRAQKKHNFLLSKARVIVEHVFGLLKGRWRILHFVNVYKVEKVVDIIVACCVLHNICLHNDDFFDCVNVEEVEIQDNEAYFRENARGIEKRDQICVSL